MITHAHRMIVVHDVAQNAPPYVLFDIPGVRSSLVTCACRHAPQMVYDDVVLGAAYGTKARGVQCTVTLAQDWMQSRWNRWSHSVKETDESLSMSSRHIAPARGEARETGVYSGVESARPPHVLLIIVLIATQRTKLDAG